MDIRVSTAKRRNSAVVSDPAKRGQRNAAWFARHAEPGSVVLIGGTGLEHFRLRVAQSHLRHDVLPSFWSMAGVAVSSRACVTVPLSIADVSAIPAANAIRTVNFQQFDDVDLFPNVAIIKFADPAGAMVDNARRLMRQRVAVDLPTMILPWLGFIWSAGAKRNPLLEGEAIPSAALVQTAFGMSGIELAPGLASGSSCPEAIWQSAIWWHDYYEKTADVMGTKVANDAAATRGTDTRPRAIVPAGQYQLRQIAAAVVD